MTADAFGPSVQRDAVRPAVSIGSSYSALRMTAIVLGVGWSVAFVLIGLRYQLQMYADGSMFSYSVAVRDTWAFHWHNISGRLFVYLFSMLPAETYVKLTADPHGGIQLYGFLFFVAQPLGLAATFLADRSHGRVIFTVACISTACLCPLVFGFPTETWMAHALFWPTLAYCHYPRGGRGGFCILFVALLALIFTHAGAVIFALVILGSLLPRGRQSVEFRRAAVAFLPALLAWLLVKTTITPDDYCAGVLMRAAQNVFNVGMFARPLFLLLFSALATYCMLFLTVRRLSPTWAQALAALLVVLGLAAYWLWFDQALHTEDRYYFRTLILMTTPALGVLAVVWAFKADGRLGPGPPRWLVAMMPDAGATARGLTGALLLVTLVHVIETAKFVEAWEEYKGALRVLATGVATDEHLGDARFVSSDRLRAGLNRLSWFSTTHFLSVLVAPNFSPARLVVDPSANYFWLSCSTATSNQEAGRAFPQSSRRLVRRHACLHR